MQNQCIFSEHPNPCPFNHQCGNLSTYKDYVKIGGEIREYDAVKGVCPAYSSIVYCSELVSVQEFRPALWDIVPAAADI